MLSDDEDFREFFCRDCGKNLGAVSIWQPKDIAIQKVRDAHNGHCPRCNRELARESKTRVNLVFAWKDLVWRFKHVFR